MGAEKNHHRAILFDLDGTLIDTAPDLARALRQTLRKNQLPPAEKDEEIRQFIGGGARKLISRAIQKMSIPQTDALMNRLEKDFLEHYADNIARESKPFPEVRETLARLSEKGFALGVCTNKREDLARALLSSLEMEDCFGVIIGGGGRFAPKPAPDGLRGALALLKAEARASVMVGDSALDVEAARAAGLSVIVATFGYSLQPPESLAADALMTHYSELNNLIERLALDGGSKSRRAVSSDGRAQRSHR